VSLEIEHHSKECTCRKRQLWSKKIYQGLLGPAFRIQQLRLWNRDIGAYHVSMTDIPGITLTRFCVNPESLTAK
jgi:hypothetical protein